MEQSNQTANPDENLKQRKENEKNEKILHIKENPVEQASKRIEIKIERENNNISKNVTGSTIDETWYTAKTHLESIASGKIDNSSEIDVRIKEENKKSEDETSESSTVTPIKTDDSEAQIEKDKQFDDWYYSRLKKQRERNARKLERQFRVWQKFDEERDKKLQNYREMFGIKTNNEPGRLYVPKDPPEIAKFKLFKKEYHYTKFYLIEALEFVRENEKKIGWGILEDILEANSHEKRELVKINGQRVEGNPSKEQIQKNNRKGNKRVRH